MLVEQSLTVIVTPGEPGTTFCQIYAYCRSLHGGRLYHQWELTFATVALQMPFWVGMTISLTTPTRAIKKTAPMSGLKQFPRLRIVVSVGYNHAHTCLGNQHGCFHAAPTSRWSRRAWHRNNLP